MSGDTDTMHVTIFQTWLPPETHSPRQNSIHSYRDTHSRFITWETMPQRDCLDRAVLQLLLSAYNSARVGRVQQQNLLPSKLSAGAQARRGADRSQMCEKDCAYNAFMIHLSSLINGQ